MTSTRRTNLFRVIAIYDTDIPLLSIGLNDLSDSMSEVSAEILPGPRVVGSGTYKPSFGQGNHSICNF